MATAFECSPTQGPAASQAARPPRIALVLGSGGVRSAAAIGIAEVLNESGLRPGLVVGCSSGALFGALVAMQIDPAKALDMAVTLWSQDLTTRRRWRAYFELLLPRLAGFDAGFGLRDSRLIGARIAQAFGSQRIEELPTPLRVVTTEAASGRRVVLEHGSLVNALRASMALPFIFPAVEIDGRLLIDGVICDPLPASVAGGCDVVVTLGFEGTMPRMIDRPSRMLGQVSTALMNNLMQARLDAARAAGRTLIAIDLPLDRRVGLWETAAMPHIYRVGRQAALQALPNILDALDNGSRRPPGIHAGTAVPLSR
jgi:NTE family protein